MRRSMQLQVIMTAALSIILIGFAGCGTTSGSSGADGSAPTSKSPTTTVDGLIKVDTEGPGSLFLREDHGIGGYDAIVIAPSFVNYRRRSTKLDPDVEEVYIVSLEQALIDEADSIGVEIRSAPGECVITIGIGFVNVDLARSGTAKVLGQMVLVIQYQDSMSGQSLLRFSVPKKIERESDGTSREQQVRRSFDQMIDEVDITTVLRKATIVPSKPRPGCNGSLLSAGLPPASN